MKTSFPGPKPVRTPSLHNSFPFLADGEDLGLLSWLFACFFFLLVLPCPPLFLALRFSLYSSSPADPSPFVSDSGTEDAPSLSTYVEVDGDRSGADSISEVSDAGSSKYLLFAAVDSRVLPLDSCGAGFCRFVSRTLSEGEASRVRLFWVWADGDWGRTRDDRRVMVIRACFCSCSAVGGGFLDFNGAYLLRTECAFVVLASVNVDAPCTLLVVQGCLSRAEPGSVSHRRKTPTLPLGLYLYYNSQPKKRPSK